MVTIRLFLVLRHLPNQLLVNDCMWHVHFSKCMEHQHREPNRIKTFVLIGTLIREVYSRLMTSFRRLYCTFLALNVCVFLKNNKCKSRLISNFSNTKCTILLFVSCTMHALFTNVIRKLVQI